MNISTIFRRNVKLLTLLFLCGTISPAYTQFKIYSDLVPLSAAYPPSVRAAAMGFSGVAQGGTIQEAFINPASIGFMTQQLQTAFTYSAPAFVERKSYNMFYGAAVKVTSRLAIAFYSFGYKATDIIWEPNIQNINFKPSKIAETYYTLNAAYRIIDGLSLGVNLNYLTHTLAPVKPVVSKFADVGLLYSKNFKVSADSSVMAKRLRIGVSYSNLNAAYTRWVFPTGESDTLYISSRLMAGISYLHSISIKKLMYGNVKMIPLNARTIDFLAQVQYLKYMPWKSKRQEQPFFWGVGGGLELTFVKIVSLRFGYRYEKRFGDELPLGSTNTVNYPYLKGFTFGTGFNIPLKNVTNGKCPFDMTIDYMYRKPFTWIKSNPVQREYSATNISVSLNWMFK